MLTDQEEDQRTEEEQGNISEAWVARTRSGSDHHNTLTPHWDFDFSV